MARLLTDNLGGTPLSKHRVTKECRRSYRWIASDNPAMRRVGLKANHLDHENSPIPRRHFSAMDSYHLL
jgi:hypothetical protein